MGHSPVRRVKLPEATYHVIKKHVIKKHVIKKTSLRYLPLKATSQFRKTKGAETLVAVETGHVLLSNGPQVLRKKNGGYGSKPCYPWAPGTLKKLV